MKRCRTWDCHTSTAQQVYVYTSCCKWVCAITHRNARDGKLWSREKNGKSSHLCAPWQQGDELLEYERLKVGRSIICSEKYSRHLRVDRTAVLLKDGTHAKPGKLFCCREPSGRRNFLILSSAYSTEAVMLWEHIKLAWKRRENLYTIDKYVRPCAYFSLAGKMYWPAKQVSLRAYIKSVGSWRHTEKACAILILESSTLHSGVVLVGFNLVGYYWCEIGVIH